MTPDLEGLEVVYPLGVQAGESVEMDIEAGQDHVVILRRTEGACSFRLSRLTHERAYSDEEYV